VTGPAAEGGTGAVQPNEAGEAPRPDTFELVTYLGSPIALGTALFLYFGWVRSEAQARAFGADASVFDMSTQDLVLRSVNVMFLAVFALLLLGLLAFRLDGVLRRRAAAFAPVLRYAWVLVPVGLLLRAVTGSVGDLVFPTWVLLAIGGTSYGGVLRRHAEGDRSALRFGPLVVVVLLLVAALFWQTERVARATGGAMADDLKDHLACRLPAATVFSTGRLGIELAQVEEIGLTGEGDSAFRYRYEGLFLLQRSGDKYFLLTDGWRAGDGRLVLVPDSPAVRLEFGAPRSEAACGGSPHAGVERRRRTGPSPPAGQLGVRHDDAPSPSA
jgi:hypothetical protein